MSSSSQKSPRGRKSPNRPQNLPPSHHSDKPHPNQPQQSQTPSQSDVVKPPGMFQRVAETAAGVAVGSAVGNLVTNAVSSLFGSSSSTDSKSVESTAKSADEKNVCEREKLNFIHCTEKEADLAKCEELQKEYKECRLKYNLP